MAGQKVNLVKMSPNESSHITELSKHWQGGCKLTAEYVGIADVTSRLIKKHVDLLSISE
eukprot:SAG31_NODE_1274_length_9050_cov_10.910178_4_plen_59_part_00